jgi:hypothetical protein
MLHDREHSGILGEGPGGLSPGLNITTPKPVDQMLIAHFVFGWATQWCGGFVSTEVMISRDSKINNSTPSDYHKQSEANPLRKNG